MMSSIVKSSLKFQFLVITIAIALMAFGITQFRSMPVDVLPEYQLPYVEIQTEALGLSAEEVEQMITVPMEQDLLAGVAWLDVIRSESVPGLSSVVVYFEPGTDLYRARQMVTEYGMSDTIGPRTLGQKQGEVFLGRDWGSTPDYSDAVAFEIDQEVRELIDEAHDVALEILTKERM